MEIPCAVIKGVATKTKMCVIMGMLIRMVCMQLCMWEVGILLAAKPWRWMECFIMRNLSMFCQYLAVQQRSSWMDKDISSMARSSSSRLTCCSRQGFLSCGNDVILVLLVTLISNNLEIRIRPDVVGGGPA